MARDATRLGGGDPPDERAVVVVGGGVSGLSAATFTARAGLDTLVVDGGESILARNAHLENFPGFPAGVDARLLLDAMRDQAGRAGASFREARVTDVATRTRDADALDAGSAVGTDIGRTPDADSGETAGPFVVSTEDGRLLADRVVAASWSDAAYLDGVDADRVHRGSKTYVEVDRDGRANVAGVYAAGRLAGQYHQAVVAAGHGATVGVTVVHDAGVPFYHDWVTPAGYFTGRDRAVPPGCEEIDDDERRRRDEAARRDLRERVADPFDDEPTMHPNVADEE